MTAIGRLLPALARWRLLIAAAAGAATSFAFAPYGLFPLAIAGPAILILLWEDATPRQAARAGFLFGVALFGAGTWWIFTAVYEFGGTPIWLAIFIMVVVLAIKGSYYLLLGWLVARASRLQRAVRLLVLLPGAWLVMEWVRGWMFTGFPWLQLGYAHSDNWLIALAPVGGIHLVTLLTAILAGALVLLLLGSARERVAAVVAAVAIWGAAFAVRDGNWTAPAGEAMPIALVQGAIPQDEKWLVEHRTTTLERYHALNREALGARIIVWPESAIPVLAHEAEPFLDLIRREGRAAGSDVMVGLLSFDFETSEIRNGLYSMSADGDGWYFKRRLVPFGEFFPVPAFVRKWMRLMSLPYYDMTPGADDQAPLTAGGQELHRDDLLRGRLRRRPARRARDRDAARQCHQQRLVRRFLGAAPAIADGALPRARSGALADARDQQRHHRRDRARRQLAARAPAVRARRPEIHRPAPHRPHALRPRRQQAGARRRVPA